MPTVGDEFVCRNTGRCNHEAMPEVEFRWNQTPRNGAGELEVRVDGQALADWIRAVELPFARAEGAEVIAGSYSGLSASHCPDDLVSHFLGGEDSHLDAGPRDKTVLLGCECGDVGCWPLMAQIQTTSESVAWTDFEQPHRRELWSYEAATPLMFDRTQYEDAIAAAVQERRSAR